MNEPSPYQVFEHGGEVIKRETLRTSMSDGAWLTSYRYSNINCEHDHQFPLLCLPDELGRAKDHHRLALSLLALKDQPAFIHTLSLRGRGTSDATNVANTSVLDDADDLISFFDARDLHHCNMVVNGRAIYVLLLALIKRPGLVKRVILNDAAPEFDTVAIARETALNQRSNAPDTWEEAIDIMRERKSNSFTTFSDDDWEHAASIRWLDVDGKPATTNDPKLVRFSNAADYDEPQPRLWREFKLLSEISVLLMRGENSDLVTQEISDKMSIENPKLKTKIAKGQGHVPALYIGDLPQHLSDFLSNE